jgi:hypothetical protein
MFRPFFTHPQEILYCLVSRYGKRKCALWCPVVWCGRSFHGTVWVYTHQSIYITAVSLCMIHTPACFDVLVSSSRISIYVPCLVAWILEVQLLELQFHRIVEILKYYLVVFTIKSIRLCCLLCKQCVFVAACAVYSKYGCCCTEEYMSYRGHIEYTQWWTKIVMLTEFTLRQCHGKSDHTKLPDTITHTFVYHNGWPGSIVSPEDEQGTAETRRDVLNKITTISDIKLDIHIYIYI